MEQARTASRRTRTCCSIPYRGGTQLVDAPVGGRRNGRILSGMQHDLSNRVAIVTGASRGLGAAIALKLGQGGAKVAVNYHGSPEKAERVAQQITEAGGKAFAV